MISDPCRFPRLTPRPIILGAVAHPSDMFDHETKHLKGGLVENCVGA